MDLRRPAAAPSRNWLDQPVSTLRASPIESLLAVMAAVGSAPVTPVIGGEGDQKLNYGCPEMRRTGYELGNGAMTADPAGTGGPPASESPEGAGCPQPARGGKPP